MRILEGMKNATAQMTADVAVTNDAHKPHPASHHIVAHPAHANHPAGHVTLAEPNGVCGDNGNGSSAHIREQMKRMIQNGGHENGAKLSQEHSNGVKPAECTAPMQRTLAAQAAAIPPQNNKPLPQHCGSSLTAPCAKALYDFESKEAG